MAVNSSVRQWKRVAEVIVGKGGSGVSIAQNRIAFEINKTVDAVPNNAVIRIFNLTADNELRIRDEFNEVVLNAGYVDAPKLLFRGSIINVSRYRDGTDRIVEIQAGDGDRDYRTATVQATLAAGTKNAQVIDRVLQSFKDTIRGAISIPEIARLRGKVLSGNTRDILDALAVDTGSHWSIQDGTLQVISANDVKPGIAVVITSETGMIGAPERNDRGVGVRTLLNPEIGINGAIKLDNNGIRKKIEFARTLALSRETRETVSKPPVRLDPDGIYKVIRVKHTGDTRGAEWYSDVEAIGLDQPIPENRQ